MDRADRPARWCPIAGAQQIFEEISMLVSKRILLISGAFAVMGFASVAMAQAPAAKAGAKSTQVTTMDEGDAIMIGPKGQRVHKSNSKVSAAKHQAALAKGAKEIPGGAVIYKQNGKLYMLQDTANEKASQSFQGDFDTDY
jgi:hypothetical protein